MALLDGVIALGIVLLFGYFIVIRMKDKYPSVGEFLASFFTGGLRNKEEATASQKSQQVWTEHRATI